MSNIKIQLNYKTENDNYTSIYIKSDSDCIYRDTNNTPTVGSNLTQVMQSMVNTYIPLYGNSINLQWGNTNNIKNNSIWSLDAANSINCMYFGEDDVVIRYYPYANSGYSSKSFEVQRGIDSNVLFSKTTLEMINLVGYVNNTSSSNRTSIWFSDVKVVQFKEGLKFFCLVDLYVQEICTDSNIPIYIILTYNYETQILSKAYTYSFSRSEYSTRGGVIEFHTVIDDEDLVMWLLSTKGWCGRTNLLNYSWSSTPSWYNDWNGGIDASTSLVSYFLNVYSGNPFFIRQINYDFYWVYVGSAGSVTPSIYSLTPTEGVLLKIWNMVYNGYLMLLCEVQINDSEIVSQIWIKDNIKFNSQFNSTWKKITLPTQKFLRYFSRSASITTQSKTGLYLRFKPTNFTYQDGLLHFFDGIGGEMIGKIKITKGEIDVDFTMTSLKINEYWIPNSVRELQNKNYDYWWFPSFYTKPTYYGGGIVVYNMFYTLQFATDRTLISRYIHPYNAIPPSVSSTGHGYIYTSNI